MGHSKVSRGNYYNWDTSRFGSGNDACRRLDLDGTEQKSLRQKIVQGRLQMVLLPIWILILGMGYHCIFR